LKKARDLVIENSGHWCKKWLYWYAYCLNNPLKYVDPSGYSYLQTLQQTYNYEGGGFWYRGDYYSWSDDYGFGGGFSNSSGYLLNSGTYSYNASTNQYYDGYGRKVDFREVLHEYIIPIGVEIDWMTISGTKSNPYQHIGMVYYTDGTKANWDMDIDQSWNLPVTMNSIPSTNVGWVADMTGKICAGVLEFAIGFLGGAEVGLVRSTSIAKSIGRVFWSSGGNEAVKVAAREFATTYGMKTIEMTTTGKVLEWLTNATSYKFTRPFWEWASGNFARGATGTVNVFQNAGGIGVESIWGTVEYSILQTNKVKIIYHIVP